MKKGLTLIEILVALAILMLLLGITFMNLSGSNLETEVSNAAEDLSGVLREAQSQSMAVVNGKAHGVHFDQNEQTAILFEGEQFLPNHPLNRRLSLSSQVQYSLIELTGGGDNIIFEKLTGNTNQYGRIRFASTKNPSIDAQITISPQGKISTEP